jgi:hypothetical protein
VLLAAAGTVAGPQRRPGSRATRLKTIELDGLTQTQISDLQEFQNAAKRYGIHFIPQSAPMAAS